MDHSTLYGFLEFIGKVLASASVVLAAIWRALNGMISKKIQEQLSVMSQEVTKVNTEQMNQLRQEIREQHKEQREDIRELRQRVDDIVGR